MAWPWTNDDPYDEVVRANDLKFDLKDQEPSPALSNLMRDSFERLTKSMSRDMLACVAAGVGLKYEWKQTDTGLEIIATTTVPCAVRWDGDKPTVYVGREP